MPESAIAEAPVTTSVTAPAAPQPPISMSFVDKVKAAATPEVKLPPAKEAAKVEVAKPIIKADEITTGKVVVDKSENKAAAKEAAKPDDAKFEWKTAPEQFRKSHEKTLARLRELESKAAPKVDEAPEFKALSERVAAKEKEFSELQKRAEELEQTIRYVDYEKSPDFKEKFHKPWVDAYQEGVTEATKLTVVNFNADGLEEGRRKLTTKEFDSIVTDPDLDSAIDKAEKLFQNATRANQVLEYRKRFIAATKAMEAAKSEYRTKGQEIEKQTAAQRAEQHRAERELLVKHNKEWADKNPQWVTPDEGDDEGAKKLELGQKAADLAFSDTSHLGPEKRARLYADTKNRAAAFGHVAHKLTKAEARITELEARLKEFEDSEPGKGELKADAAVAEESFAQRLAKVTK